MKGQVKALVVAMALGAGSANAAIDTAASGNGELFFSMWDKVAQVGFTKDLGIKMDDFLIGTANATSNITINMATDSNWSSFLSQTIAANSVWMIGAMDNTNKTTAGGSRFLSTSKNTLANVNTTTNSLLASFDQTDSILIAGNSTGTHATQANGSAILTAANDPIAYPQTALFDLETWSLKAKNWTSTAGTSESQNFYFLTNNSAGGLKPVTAGQFMVDGSTAATWSVDLATNALNFNGAPNDVVATPIPAAAWLLGSALMGLVGVGRRQSKANVIAA